MVIRAHVVLPDELVKALDELVGPRGRSQYIAEAVREKILRDRQRKALLASAGILATEDIPEWSTPETTSEWIRRGRQESRSLPTSSEQ